MGINCGAFLGILLCGYLGENIGWHWGFGVAGILCFLAYSVLFCPKYFWLIGLKPEKVKEVDEIKNHSPMTSIELDKF